MDRERQRGKLVETTIIKLGLSARAYSRVLMVGRTIPISAGIDEIQPTHIAKAIRYRSLDRDCKIVRKDLIEGIIGNPVKFFYNDLALFSGHIPN